MIWKFYKSALYCFESSRSHQTYIFIKQQMTGGTDNIFFVRIFWRLRKEYQPCIDCGNFSAVFNSEISNTLPIFDRKYFKKRRSKTTAWSGMLYTTLNIKKKAMAKPKRLLECNVKLFEFSLKSESWYSQSLESFESIIISSSKFSSMHVWMHNYTKRTDTCTYIRSYSNSNSNFSKIIQLTSYIQNQIILKGSYNVHIYVAIVVTIHIFVASWLHSYL